ncbi:DUF1707 SHOCT-like domain-containing protein [Pseudonocardia endophytica]|nr:DUF1707 domain-containing protein [Pseudonocardia endophytica]
MAVEQQVRIGDDERERAVGRLSEHVGSGRLDLAEFETRSAAAYAARTRVDLDAVFADLPVGRPAPAPSRERDPRAVHRIVMTSVWGSWVASSVICLVIWAMVAVGTGSLGYFWPMWVIGPWGAMLAIGTVTGGRVCGSRRTV